MSVLSAVAAGCQRVLRAPVLVFGLWLTYILVPIPVAIDLDDVVFAGLDVSAIDPAPALILLQRDGEMAAHAALVMFLLGGFMDRLARDRATATFGFFGASGMFFFRFLRLAAIAAVAYLPVFLLVSRLALDSLASAAPVAVLVLALNVIFDFARVRMVVEDRRSAFGALAAGFRFVRRNIGAALAVVVINVALAGATWWLAATFEIGDTAAIYAYVLARALLRLIFIASSVALFQGRLAHAGYVARPVATWPESPAAEAVLPR